MSTETDSPQSVSPTSEVLPVLPTVSAGTKRSRRGTTPVSTATIPATTSTTARKSRRLERVPVSLSEPAVLDPMEGPSRRPTASEAALLVPSSSSASTVVSVKEAMMEVFADPEFRSLFFPPTTSASFLPAASTGSYLAVQDSINAPPREEFGMKSEVLGPVSELIPSTATSVTRSVSSRKFNNYMV